MENNLCSCLNNCELFNWTDPKKSGAILGLFNLYFILTSFSHLNLFTIAAYMLLFYVVAGIVISQFLERAPKDDDEYEHVSKDMVESTLKQVYNFSYDIDQYFRRVISLTDPKLTLKFYVMLYSLITLSGIGCMSFFAWLGVNALFLWRPIYAKNQNLIDNLYGTAKGVAYATFYKVEALIPRYDETATEKKKN